MIPIDFVNDGTVVGLQIDLRIPIDQLRRVVSTQCFDDAFSGISGCSQLPPPNQDIVRFAIVAIDGNPLPSGRMAELPVVVSRDAVNGTYPLDLLDNFTIAGRIDGTQVLPLTLNDGSLRIFGGLLEPPDDSEEPPDDASDPSPPGDPSQGPPYPTPPGGIGGGGPTFSPGPGPPSGSFPSPVGIPTLGGLPGKLTLIGAMLILGLLELRRR